MLGFAKEVLALLIVQPGLHDPNRGVADIIRAVNNPDRVVQGVNYMTNDLSEAFYDRIYELENLI